MNAKTDDLITRFLLGELSEQERAHVEERFLADNEFFEEILSAEDALLEQYLQGRLSGEQLERAKTLFQSSLLQKREVEFTKGLMASLSADVQKNEQTTSVITQTDFPLIQPGFFKQLAARRATLGWLFVLLVCLLLVSWIAYLYSQKKVWEIQLASVERSNREVREKLLAATQGQAELSKQLEDERERRAKAEELIAQLQVHKPNAGAKLNSITSLLLAPATLERGSHAKTVRLKAETNFIKLQLELGANQRYSQYSLQLKTFDGSIVWNKSSIGSGQIKQGRLSLVLPSSLLEYEDYRVELKGLSDNGDFVHVADYIFKVRK